jgi:lipid A 3-O-deacylase
MGAAAWFVVILPLEAQELARTARLTVDNDYFAFWQPPRQRPDDNYTHGMRIAWDIDRTPAFARKLVCPPGFACGTAIEIGQEIYTPIFDYDVHVDGDRPYAGWLYARVQIRGGASTVLRTAEGTLGITGPPSLAEAVQNGFHRLVPEFRRPEGWARQLPAEPSFAVRASQSWRIAPASVERIFDVVPSVSGQAGTLRIAAAAGARARIGLPLSHPWLESDSGGLAPYAFVGLRTEVVARDLFIDGTLFRRSFRAKRTSLRAEWEIGAGLRLRRFSLEYRAVTRTREYDFGAMPSRHTHGSVALGWQFH